jgi:uncharacterized protein with HEPN domain
VPSRKPVSRFADIIYSIDAVARYTAALDERAFVQDSMRVDAVERCLSRLSGAATKLGTLAERLEPGSPWRKIRAYGNYLRHEYDIIEPADLRAIATTELPALRAARERAIQRIHQGAFGGAELTR